MSSKIEVSREQLERWTTGRISLSHLEEIRTLLAAPVVERQPVAYEYYSKPLRTWRPLETEADKARAESMGCDVREIAPPELAELQATIAGLTEENERLKGGQGEPVAVVVSSSWNSETGSSCVIQAITPTVLDSGTKLYTSQPAPVSVPEGWKLVPIVPTETMLNVLHGRVLISVNWRKKEANILNDKAWWKAVVESAPACLDKVKELNQ